MALQAVEEKKPERESSDDINQPRKRTIVVFGGNGFFGTRICERAVAEGYRVISISRSGGPPDNVIGTDWCKKVYWKCGDAQIESSYAQLLLTEQPYAILTMMGCFNICDNLTKSPKQIELIAGDTNVNVIRFAKRRLQSVKKVIYISANLKILDTFGVTDEDSCCGFARLIAGQLYAKKKAEDCVKSEFGQFGLCLRPGIPDGRRYRKLGCGRMSISIPVYMPPLFNCRVTRWGYDLANWMFPGTFTATDVFVDSCLQFLDNPQTSIDEIQLKYPFYV